MKKSHKIIAFLLIVVSLVSFTIISQKVPGQLDWTDRNLYTLSDASKDLVANLEEPVHLEYYFSHSIEDLPISVKNYGVLVEDVLRQYADASNGSLTLSVIDPEPDTEQEEAAIRAGLERQSTVTGNNVFFGLVATSADQSEVIPFFQIARESFLEYDISQIIHKVRLFEKPALGVISSLPVMGNQPQPQYPGMPPQGQGTPPWAIIESLGASFEVEEITGDEIPENIAALALIHPGELSDDLRFAIDQFFLSGKPVFLAVDPSSFEQRATQQNPQMMMMGGASFSSDLPGLLEAWGIEYDPSLVVGDINAGTPVSTGRGAPIDYPFWITKRDLDTDSPIVGQLNEIMLPEPGCFSVAEDRGYDVQVLLKTSDRSGTMDAMTLSYQPPQAAVQSFEPDGKSRTIAAMIRGTFKSAFPDGKPKEENEEDEEDVTEIDWTKAPSLREGASTLIMVADTDFLSDRASIRRVSFLGMSGVTPVNDNINLVLNCVESLAGDQALLGLRGKGEVRRTFTKIEEMERKANEAYQRELESLQQRLQEVQTKLSELQQTQGGTQLVASPEVIKAVEEYQQQEADLRSELREIRKRLREDVDALKFKLSALNVGLIPLLVLVAGIFSFASRGRTPAKR